MHTVGVYASIHSFIKLTKAMFKLSSPKLHHMLDGSQFEWRFEPSDIIITDTCTFVNIYSSWVIHWKMAINLANITAQSIASFFFERGNHNVTIALNTFNAKINPQLFYGIPLWINNALECKFL